MQQQNVLSWYEASLPPQERKMRGHFSTPPQLVERILDACGYTADNDLARIRVLDPACGSGNFLAGVASRLLASAYRVGLSHKAQIMAVQRNIWGFDPDPVACFLAEMQLRTIVAERSRECYTHACRMCKHQQTVPFHIHQADGLALPWKQDANIDLFLANPPYLATKNNDLSGYRYARQRGQADSYLLFLNLALQVVRPGGWIGLVIPDPVLARSNATLERQHLLAEATVHSLWHLSDVFPAHVGAVVIIAQKRSPSSLHQVKWLRGAWPRVCESATKDRAYPQESGVDSSDTSHSIPQSLLRSQPGSELRYLLSDAQDSLVGRLHAYLCTTHAMRERRFVPLSELVLIRRGEELSKESGLLVQRKPEDGREWLPVLRGGVDLQAYTHPIADSWILREGVVKPLERYLKPKLLVVKSTGRLQAALDLRGHVVLQTLYLLCPYTDDANEHYFLLALLNSRLLQEYVSVLYTAYKWVQPQIEQRVLTHLPIPTLETAEKVSISQRAQALMSACSKGEPVVELSEQYNQIYEEQERAICALYEKLLLGR
ncbi:MAG: N-6 DNA methylase [Ktedonobacteraceae bacterium]|nr:N-6 DNA methylase [Ktedonobacteraceae bacterium]